MSAAEAPRFNQMADAMRAQHPEVDDLNPSDRVGIRNFLFGTLPGRKSYYRTYQAPRDNGERLVRLPETMRTGSKGRIIAVYDREDAAAMRQHAGGDYMAARERFIDELQVVAEAVGKRNGHILRLTDVWRPPTLQQLYFDETYAELATAGPRTEEEEETLLDEVHRLSAWLPAAEHLMGGRYRLGDFRC